MRLEGTLKTWNDERGFGFIESTSGGQEIFVHIKAFPPGVGRPALNLQLTFDVEQAADGKKRAKNVQFVQSARATAQRKRQPTAQWEKASIFALAIFAL